ncbi:Uma2 family endonuclease [Anatilimnocola sp. NA78]|uniref:Uma2 family endonuclease n=1 Tax=Anatilimnocola sp. NA78 TaxID=3415683 RepID=UPI003CE505EB
MSAVKKLQPISVADYLAGELVSRVKHEYVGGHVYAMAGARVAHNRIATNVVGLTHAQLKGKRCQPFNSDMKVHVPKPPQERFYYPDASVVCQSNPAEDSYQDQPVVIFEVLSQQTRRLDEGEKKDGYLRIPSLAVYVLIEQEAAAVVVHRRTASGFVREEFVGLDATIPLLEIEVSLPLAEIYAGVEFVPEPVEE